MSWRRRLRRVMSCIMFGRGLREDRPRDRRCLADRLGAPAQARANLDAWAMEAIHPPRKVAHQQAVSTAARAPKKGKDGASYTPGSALALSPDRCGGPRGRPRARRVGGVHAVGRLPPEAR